MAVDAYNRDMSQKRYQFKLIEAADAAELTRQLSDAGTKLWSAVGYNVLPDGRRSVLLERKIKLKVRRHHSKHRDEKYALADR